MVLATTAGGVYLLTDAVCVVVTFLGLSIYWFMCMFEGRYQYAGWLYTMLMRLWDMIEEHKSCLSNVNVPFHITLHTYKNPFRVTILPHPIMIELQMGASGPGTPCVLAETCPSTDRTP